MNLLAIRLSAMGDAALALPAIRSVLDRHPAARVTIVTRKQFRPFFEHIERLQCVTADVKGKHKGIPGLYRLYREIKKTHRPDAVLDLHDVLRSRILSFFFRTGDTPVFRIDKGREEKRKLTAKNNKQFRPLTHTVQRYLDVFDRAGYPAALSPRTHWFAHTPVPESFLRQHAMLPKTAAWIGIAPFARHREKKWPLEKTEQVIAALRSMHVRVFLFGGGAEEISLLHGLKERHTHVTVAAGELSLPGELGLMSRLDMMLSMDSANMHLAALCGIPVISVWGATHPYAGFGPLNGNEKNIVQVPFEELTCRPCSVFGNKPCWRGDHACMEWIAPEKVLEQIKFIIHKTAGE